MDILGITLKLLLAVCLGGLIGWEREASGKPAGLRTNTLICLGSTMLMALSQEVLRIKPESADPLRIAAGVITGIGFIGAGTIIQARGHVIGLTSAATLWTVSSLGLVIGTGYYILAAIFTGLVLLTLVAFRKIEAIYAHSRQFNYRLKIAAGSNAVAGIRKLILHLGLRMENFNCKKERDHQNVIFTLSASEEKEQLFNENLAEMPDILEMKVD